MAIPPVTGAVNSAIHDALKNAVQLIADEHGVQVEIASIRWTDISTVGAIRRIVQEVQLHTVKTY